MRKKTLALIDGEHYPQVVKHALEKRKDISLLFMVGGAEKLKSEKTDYGIPIIKAGKDLFGSLEQAIKKNRIEKVLDMSGDPILLTHERFRIAEIALRNFADYQGADFMFESVKEKQRLEIPSMQIIGTGKRVGKTAISSYACRLLKKEGHDPLVITMGRGGSEKPEIVDGEKIEITPEYLLEENRKGKHAASDCWEDALTAKVLAIGCRRCGSGLSGKTIEDNLAEGIEIANRTGKKFAVIEGSGDIVPDEKCGTRLLVVGAGQKIETLDRYLMPYRYSISDAVFISMCETAERERKTEKIERMIRKRKDLPIIKTVFRPRPLESVKGERVFLAYTADKRIVEKSIIPYLEERYKCEITGYTKELANRKNLIKDMEKGLQNSEIVLTELKAAGVDTVTKEGIAEGKKVVYSENIPIEADSMEEKRIEKAILELVKIAKERFRG